ncbi:hypothetical protein, partial [uncultured Bacteroides sp.]|uniref:hypothetical protein n=1 Tax=uncultured Bacteroides sp. TaxID=162156 RepID=UPI0025900107
KGRKENKGKKHAQGRMLTIKACNYINETSVFIIKACIYSFLFDKNNFRIKGKEVCHKELITFLLIAKMIDKGTL